MSEHVLQLQNLVVHTVHRVFILEEVVLVLLLLLQFKIFGPCCNAAVGVVQRLAGGPLGLHKTTCADGAWVVDRQAVVRGAYVVRGTKLGQVDFG